MLFISESRFQQAGAAIRFASEWGWRRCVSVLVLLLVTGLSVEGDEVSVDAPALADLEYQSLSPKEATLLARDLLSTSTLSWNWLKPTELLSDGGSLKILRDQSVLAAGYNPDQDTISLSARPPLPRITHILLQAMPHRSLPNDGPGRGKTGNFHVNEFQVTSAGTSIPITQLAHVYDQVGEAGLMIDGQVDSHWGWSNHPRSGTANEAIFAIDLERDPTDPLQIQIHCSTTKYKAHSLGRFRIGVIDDDQALAIESTRFAALALLHDSQVRNPYGKLAIALHWGGHQQSLQRLLDARPEACTGLSRMLIENGEWQAAIAVHSRQLKTKSDDAEVLVDRATVYLQSGNRKLARADVVRGASIAISKGRQRLAGRFADLLLKLSQTPWRVLEMQGVADNHGIKLKLQSDGSILATPGEVSWERPYRLIWKLQDEPIAALRLEILPDPSMPRGGVGHHSSGNAHLMEVRVYVDDEHGRQRVSVASASASFSADGRPIENAIDGSLHTEWHVFGRQTQPHQAIFRLQTPIDQDAKALILEMHQRLELEFGRFRWSSVSDVGLIDAENQIHIAMRLKDPWQKLAAAYKIAGRQTDLDGLLKRSPEAQAGLDAIDMGDAR